MANRISDPDRNLLPRRRGIPSVRQRRHSTLEQPRKNRNRRHSTNRRTSSTPKRNKSCLKPPKKIEALAHMTQLNLLQDSFLVAEANKDLSLKKKPYSEFYVMLYILNLNTKCAILDKRGLTLEIASAKRLTLENSQSLPSRRARCQVLQKNLNFIYLTEIPKWAIFHNPR